MSGPSLSGVIAGGFAVSLTTRDGAAIDPAKETWVVAHGWLENPAMMQDLAAQIQAQRPGAQVLLLDWSAAAADGAAAAEDRTPSVGAWVASALSGAGFAGAVNLVGYSYGAYVAAEAAKGLPGGADVLIAIDPGRDAPGSVYDPAALNFAALSKFSLAFYADAFYGAAAIAQTADEAIAIRDSSHDAAYFIAVSLLASFDPVFALSRLLAHQPAGWLANQFDENGVLGPGGFDAALDTEDDGYTPAGLDAVLFTSGADTETLGRAGHNVHALAGDDVVRGSASVDSLYGDGGVDALFGLRGNDKLFGGANNDILVGGEGADALDGNGGSDTASYASSAARVRVNLYTGVGLDGDAQGDTYASIERLTGSDFNDQLTGSAVGNVLIGGKGVDIIDGRGGQDFLVGGAGGDVFVFSSGLGAADTIDDFSVPADTIRLDNAIFKGVATGALAASAFHTGAGASDASDRIVYNSATGFLYFDRDGTGAQAAIHFATLDAGLALSAADFAVI